MYASCEHLVKKHRETNIDCQCRGLQVFESFCLAFFLSYAICVPLSHYFFLFFSFLFFSFLFFSFLFFSFLFFSFLFFSFLFFSFLFFSFLFFSFLFFSFLFFLSFSLSHTTIMFSYGEGQVHVFVPHTTCSRGGLLHYVLREWRYVFSFLIFPFFL